MRASLRGCTKETAVLHASFAAFALAGTVLSEPLFRVGAFGVAAARFVAGVARRDDEADAALEAS